MGIMTITAESLSTQLEQAVPELYVLIAKNSVAGLDSTGIADLLGVTRAEIDETVQDQLYKDVRLIIASEYARSQTETDFGWDDIENSAIQKLSKRVQYENDTESLLKIAAVANKAVRRNSSNQNKVLDPSMGGMRVPLTLTRRITERLSSAGDRVREETQQISVIDGTAKNPTFDDIDALLGVSRKPALASQMKIQTHEPDFGIDDLEFKQS